MNKSRYIANFISGIAFLFALLFQSLHALEHLSQFVAEKHCDHHYADNENQISHSHHSGEDCFSCEFVFASAIDPQQRFEWEIHSRPGIRTANFTPGENLQKSLNTAIFLRGPPQFIA